MIAVRLSDKKEICMKARQMEEKLRLAPLMLLKSNSVDGHSPFLSVHHGKLIIVFHCRAAPKVLPKPALMAGGTRILGGGLEEALSLLSATVEDTRAENHAILVIGDINVHSLEIDKDNQMLNGTMEEQITSTYKLKPSPQTSAIHRTKPKKNILKTQLEQEEWENVYHADSVEIAYNNFLSTIVLTMNAIYPRKPQDQGRGKR
ncbi:hypothetical protein J6590_014716 [Homalodisca vitripennis]|nr:hypothetical protein J6590_014716 [Homalodisca vitripennis]